jgi:phytoene dehydrogenase-like protein
LHRDFYGKATGNWCILSRIYNGPMDFEAVVVGSGPNGLVAAIEIARAGHSVCLIESRDSIGGGVRSAELTLPGFVHDVCSAVHPLGVASPIFNALPLAKHGLEWVHPRAPLAHPFDEGTGAILHRSIDATGATLGPDAPAYSKAFSRFVRNADKLIPEILAPPVHLPRHPFLLMPFGISAIQSAQRFVQRRFRGPRARGLFAGIAAHANMPLDASPTAAIGLFLSILAHSSGWPIVKGGSQKLSDALASYFVSLGGQIMTNTHIKSMRELPPARVVMFDLTPRQILRIASDELTPSYRWELHKYRYGPGVFKLDWALNSPIPWKSPKCAEAGTVHIGGTFEEIISGEQAVAKGRCPEKPFVILSQPTLFDETRAPEGKHTAWAYCHVPSGSAIDMTDRIESQVERFAPGFRDCIIGRHAMTPKDLEKYNQNYVGGDISGGIQNILQTIARPSLRVTPYATSLKGVFICSSSTPPGGGVHGMCGYHAARAALATILYNRKQR